MFKNPELQKVYEDSKGVIDERLAKLDEISHDIKLLQQILKRSAVPRGITLGIPEGIISWFNNELHFESPEMYRKLIETPSNIRMIVHPYLSEFLCKCLAGAK